MTSLKEIKSKEDRFNFYFHQNHYYSQYPQLCPNNHLSCWGTHEQSAFAGSTQYSPEHSCPNKHPNQSPHFPQL